MSGVTDRLYSIAQKINSKQLNTELGYAPIVTMVIPFTILYVIANLTGHEIVDTCAEGKLKGKEDIKKYLDYTLVAAITIPITLLYSKLVSKDVPGYIAALSLMTIIGTSMIAHAMNKCDNANDTQKSYNSIYLTVSILALLFSVFIMVFA
jgi:hypothetical protein